MKKVCFKCKLEKDQSDFSKNKRRLDGLQINCKLCKAEYEKNYYLKIDKDKKTANVKQRIKRIQEWLVSYKKKQCCSKCGNDDFRVLEFHHYTDDKEFNVGDVASKGCGIQTLLAEISKCQCLCCNCHRIVTYEKRISGIGEGGVLACFGNRRCVGSTPTSPT